MAKFTDTITIQIRAGKGGAGAVSFRREKYIPKGGPDGGDGGKGGNVVIVSDRGYYNLSHLFPHRVYKAENGTQGMGQMKHGKDGSDCIVKVPPGSQIIDAETGDLLFDFVDDDAQFIAAEGGIGGKGNAFFKSSTHQTPRFAQPGMPGEEKGLTINLKLIADVGLVGLPNAGKSTLLSTITNAKPKIGAYPFTTLIPNLGVVEVAGKGIYTIADIPGIIEGAHKGHGLGLSFLQHIERVKVILYLIDITEKDIHYNLELLRSELKTYNEDLLNRPFAIVLTKTDLVEEDEVEDKLHECTERAIAISSVEKSNISELDALLQELLENSNAS